MNFLGQNIRYLRRQYSNTQTELASLIQKGQTTIGNWENGISEPNVEELLILSNYFDISLDILIKVDLSKTNWVSVKKQEQPPVHDSADSASAQRTTVTYDHSSKEESVVRESDRDGEDLAYVVKEISSLREEIRHIQSRLSKQYATYPLPKKTKEDKQAGEKKKSPESRKLPEGKKLKEGNKLQGGRKLQGDNKLPGSRKPVAHKKAPATGKRLKK